jgi:DNA-binding LacI/PurR family transcriptional regulator
MLANGLEKQIGAAFATEGSEVGGYQAALELLKRDPIPTAITCYSDILAVGAQQALQEHFERTGVRIALTGYDNTYLSRLKQISLTSVEPQNELIAKKCIEILLEELKNPRSKGREFLIEPYLVVRASSAFDKI